MNVFGAQRSVLNSRDKWPATLALLFALLIPGHAQTSTSPGIATLHVSTDVIEVPVLAFRPPFRRVSGLLSKDFMIRLDGGLPFHPRYVHVEGFEPLSLGVLVDAEMQDPETLSRSLQHAMRGLSSDLINDTDRLSVYLFGCRLVRTIRNSAVHSATSKDLLMDALSTTSFQVASEGGSACHPPVVGEMIEAVISQLAQTSGWKVLLMFVNEGRSLDLNALDGIRVKAAAHGITLFVIRYPDDAGSPQAAYSDTEGFDLLSSSLGGISFFSSFEDFGRVIKEMMEDIRGRYILSFSRPANGNAGIHSLQVSSRVRGVKVLASAASAPLLDDNLCAANKDSSLCTSDRPSYGTKRPPQ